jgi:hypothetical protein
VHPQYATLFDMVGPWEGIIFFQSCCFSITCTLEIKFLMYATFFFSKNEMALFDSVNVEKLLPTW